MLVGAHVSVSKGYESALDYARSVGCECAQIFAKSPRQWQAKPLDESAAGAFAEARAAAGFGPLFTHTAYLINLSTSDDTLRDRSIDALADELRRGALLGAAGVVTHIGNDPQADPAAAALRAGRAAHEAVSRAGSAACGTRLLLENTAGAGRTFGGSFQELDLTIRAAELPPELLGVCFDTCHGFAFGYELDTAEGWKRVAEELAAIGGGSRLGLIHANDCKFERATNKDRHEWIGDGHIGTDGFRAMMCEPLLANTPVVTEMPGEVPVKDEVNVARLKELRSACGGSQ